MKNMFLQIPVSSLLAINVSNNNKYQTLFAFVLDLTPEDLQTR